MFFFEDNDKLLEVFKLGNDLFIFVVSVGLEEERSEVGIVVKFYLGERFWLELGIGEERSG